MEPTDDLRIVLPEGMTREQVTELLKDHGVKVKNADSRPATWRHIERVGQFLDVVIIELIRRREQHDQTKLTSPEVEAFDEMTKYLKQLSFGTPEYEASKKKLGSALTHHYAAWRHHPEHFKNGIRDMNLVDIVEFFCDCRAASERHNDGNIRKSLDVLQERFEFGNELKQILINTIELLDGIPTLTRT